MKLRMPFESEEARVLNREIMETVYFAAVEASMELAREHGPYETYPGSPASQGILQYDMWGVTPSPRWDWAGLKAKIAEHGMRNSLLLAPMPTASTSQILGNNECFEPYTSNIYSRRVTSGEFAVVNPHLLKDLTDLGLWNSRMKNRILAEGGSVQNIPEIPAELKAIYKTVWEIKMRTLIDFAAERGAFIDQSQSLNLFVAAPNTSKLTSMHFYSWRQGLKTGCYYLRTRPAADAIQFTVRYIQYFFVVLCSSQLFQCLNHVLIDFGFPQVDKELLAALGQENVSPQRSAAEGNAAALAAARLVCSRANPGACEMCSG